LKFVRCNMCKTEIPAYSGYYEVHICRTHDAAFSISERDYTEDLDICPECIRKLSDYANGRKVTHFLEE